MSEDDHLEYHAVANGLKAYPKLDGAYGGSVQVRESSTANSPHLWMDVNQLVSLNDPKGPVHGATIHLSEDTARKLSEQLMVALYNHPHQGDDR